MNADLKNAEVPPIQAENIVMHIGYAYGLHSPSVAMDLLVQKDLLAGSLKKYEQVLRKILKVDSVFEQPADRHIHAPAGDLLSWIQQIYRVYDWPIFELGKVRLRGKRVQIVIPTLMHGHQHTVKVMNWLLGILNKLVQAQDIQEDAQRWAGLCTEGKKLAPGGANVPRFLKAAFGLGIQATAIAGNVIQYGQGRRARWLDSSFTDETPQISAVLARNKVATASVLRQFGIPVAAHSLVENEQDAVRVARKIGFPVVIKPADQDGGVGVAAGLENEAEVIESFQKARKHSKAVLLERHIHGKDYRINVFHGEVLWAIERVPAGVTGDGIHSVEQLVSQVNANQKRGSGMHSALKRLQLDDEALGLLKARGYDKDSILDKALFVPLRRSSNISTGGTPISVMGRVHPDNQTLAIRAAAALRLDLAGVDLILPDISTSWKKTGGVICEVNAQPQLGAVTSMHNYGEVLNKLLPNQGNIPIIVVLGGGDTVLLVEQMAKVLASSGKNVGVAHKGGVRIGHDWVLGTNHRTYDMGRALCINNTVDAMVIGADAYSILQTGLPFDRYDMLVLADKQFTGHALKEALAMLLPACKREVVRLEGSQLNVKGAGSLTSAKWVEQEKSVQQICRRVVRVLAY